jgi:site-specific recombinase XerD
MTTHDLAPFVTTFFVRHLPAERNASPHTVAAYRDTFKLLLRFLTNTVQCPPATVKVEDLTRDRLLQFLTELETTRHNTIRTRNARLAAIHSFFRYVFDTEPALAALCQRVLAIPMKKAPHPVMGYLNETELGHLLRQVDRSSIAGERDYVLLALLYDTGARIQEILDLTPRDFQLTAPASVRLRGKGRRERVCPLLRQTARLVSRFLETTGRSTDDATPLLQNRQCQGLTRHGARYLLTKYVKHAGASLPTLQRARISPHTLRHSKAMHLLQSGIPLVTIKDILGHADVKSTEVYVQIDLDMKHDALTRAGTPTRTPSRSRRLPKDLLAWLEAL